MSLVLLVKFSSGRLLFELVYICQLLGGKKVKSRFSHTLSEKEGKKMRGKVWLIDDKSYSNSFQWRQKWCKIRRMKIRRIAIMTITQYQQVSDSSFRGIYCKITKCLHLLDCLSYKFTIFGSILDSLGTKLKPILHLSEPFWTSINSWWSLVSVSFNFAEYLSEEFAIYEEIEPISILRSDWKLIANDDSMIPRPKLGWPNRKVTFGKWRKIFSFGHSIINNWEIFQWNWCTFPM